MTLKQFWELNIRGNALDVLRKMTQMGNQAASAFSETQQRAGRMADNVKRSTGMVQQLGDRLKWLRERQEQAFDERRIAAYNRMIQRTEQQLKRLNTLGTASPATGGGFMSGMGANMMRGAGRILLPMGIAGSLMYAGNKTMGIVNDFSVASSKARAISGVRGAEFKSLQERAMAVGGATSFSGTEAMYGLTNLLQGGMTAQQAKMALPGAAYLAMAGDTSLEESSKAIISGLGQFNLPAYMASDVANMQAATVNKSPTNFRELDEAMKYLGPTMNALNRSYAESLTVVGLLAEGNIKGSLAGRALATSLVNLAKPTNQQAASIKAVGLEAYNTNGKFVGMASLLRQLEEGTAGLTDKQKQAHIQTIFGAEAFQELNVMLTAGSEQFRNFESSITGTTASVDMAREMQDHLRGDIEKAAGAWESLVTQLDNGNGAISRLLRTLTQDLTSKIEGVTVREKFGISQIENIKGYGFGNEEVSARLRLIKEYRQFTAGFSGIETEGGGKENMINQYHMMRDLIEQGFQLKSEEQHWYMTGKEASPENLRIRDEMRKELLGRVNENIKAIESEGSINSGSGDGGSNTPTTDAAIETLSSGGRRVRSVIVNIDNLIEGGINNYVNTPQEALELGETQVLDSVVRGVRGGEMLLIQGEE